MGIKEFAEEIKVVLESMLGREVRVQEANKNNGVKLYGIAVVEPELNVTPTIYLEQYFEHYKSGHTLEEIAECIYNFYMENKLQHSIDMSWFRDWESVRNRVAFKLINYEKNKELLEQIPHTKVLDLVKVYYVVVETEELGRGTVLLYNNHLQMWNISAKCLDEVATENTPKLLPAVSDAMVNVLMNMMGIEEADSEECEALPETYIMSNPARVFGAATMFYPDALREFANRLDSDMLIIPSSLHEIIMMPLRGDADLEYLKTLVYEVNRTELAHEEILSDSVYVYHRDTDSITIA